MDRVVSFSVDYLQVCEPSLMPGYPKGDQWPEAGDEWQAGPVTLIVVCSDDGTGAHGARVDLLAPTRDDLIAFVREVWGDDDPEWFDQVVGRIQQYGAA